MQIKFNEKYMEIQNTMKLQELKQLYDKEADIVIYNGFPVGDSDFDLKDGDEIHFIKRGRKLSREELEGVMISRHTPKIAQKLKNATVGIAGLGGLGSNIAVALSRIGIGHLVLADFDVVEPSNLNRQQYFIEQLGMYKTEAMLQTLKRINPYNQITLYDQKIIPENVEKIFGGCDIVIEAFDRADFKAMLIQECAKLGKITIAASGMAGYGDNDSIISRKINDKLYIVGDFINEARPGNGLMAPRVMIAAAKEANLAVEILLKD